MEVRCFLTVYLLERKQFIFNLTELTAYSFPCIAFIFVHNTWKDQVFEPEANDPRFEVVAPSMEGYSYLREFFHF